MTEKYTNLEKAIINDLRAVFRQRMKEVDFCIGEEQVEKLFREILGEPEKESFKEKYTKSSHINPQMIFEEMEKAFKNIDKVFESSDKFFSHIRRK